MRATSYILSDPGHPASGASTDVRRSLETFERSSWSALVRVIRVFVGRFLWLALMLVAESAWAAPSISVIPNQLGREDTPVGPIDFTANDPVTLPDKLVISGFSTSPSIFPPSAFSFGGSGSNRTVTLQPATNAFGGATVTILVSNGTQAASRSFLVQLAAVNDPPTLEPIPDLGVLNSGGDTWMYFSGITAGAPNESDSLTMTVFTNSNPGLFIVPPMVSYTSPFQWGNLTFKPVPNVSGVATIGLQVDDGRGSNNLVRREFAIVVTNNLVDLGVEGSHAYPYPAGVSNLLTYELRVYNGSVSEATGVVLTDVLPTNTIFLSASVTTGGACLIVDRTVTCQLGRVSRFQQAAARIQVMPTTTDLLTNRVSVTSAQFDQYPLNNSVDMLTPVIRGMDLDVVSADLPEAVLVGSNLTFSIQVTNHGLYTATNSAIQIILSENFEVLSLVSGHGSCSNGPSGMGCGLGNFAAGESAGIQVTVRPRRVGDVWAQVAAYSDSLDVEYNNNYRFSASVAARGIARATAGAAIQIPAQGAAAPYPSTLVVSGLTSRVQRITVTLHGLTHPDPRDLDILLVGPDGRSVLLLSDIEGTGNANDVTLTLDDFFPQVPADPIVSGRYAPTDYSDFESDVDAFPPPAPSGRPWTYLDVFRGSNPNGVWSLYIVDDSPVGGTGVLAGGWSLMLGLGDRDISESAHFRGIVATGTSGAGPGGKFTELGRPVINSAGQVAFVGNVEITTPEGWTDSASGIWTAGTPQDIRRLAGDGENPPGFGVGWRFEIQSDDPAPALNDAGLFSFGAHVSDPDQGFDYFGIWSGTASNTLDDLALTDDVVPGVGGERSFREISRPYLSDSGVVAFRGRAERDFFGNSFTGYWIGSSRTNLAVLARSGQPAPGVDGFFTTFEDFDSPTPLFDTAGNLAFRANTETDFGNAPGIWMGGSSQDLRLVAAAGTPTPALSPGQSFDDGITSWLLFGSDSEGRVYFRADVRNDFGPGFLGMWKGKSPDDLELLFRTGTPIAVGTNRIVFDNFGCPLVSPDGLVMFSAEFRNEDGPLSTGIWIGRGSNDLTLVAYDGQSLPGVGGAVMRDLWVDCLLRGVNGFSRFVFAATLEDSPGEINQALLAFDPAVGLKLVARVGDVIEFGSGNFRRISEIITLVDPDGSGPERSGGRRMINDASEVAFLAYFDNDTLGVVVSQLGSASVEGGVWYDRTADSMRDATEPGVPQARVDLFSPGIDGQPGGGDDVLVASRLTNGDGHYRLGVMQVGQYFLQFTPPLGFGFVARDQGGDDSTDSDADTVTGRTSVFALAATTQKTDLSAGLVSGFAVGDTQVTEGDTGERAMLFTVSLGVPRRFPVSVSYATASGTAQAGVDFTPASGALTFNPGEAAKFVAVMVKGDSLLEYNETVLLNLSSAVEAPIVRAQGTGHIINDDPMPPTPTQPIPPQRSVLQPLNGILSWRAVRTRELLTNGGFEFGNFTGWMVEPSGIGERGFVLFSDGQAAEGQVYAAVSGEASSQPRVLSRRVLMPSQLRSARLSWSQGYFELLGLGEESQFRVEVRDESRQPLAVVYQATLVDLPFDWGNAAADLGAFGGRLIEIAFIVESPFRSPGVKLDNVRLEVDDTAGNTFDVYFGTEPVPGAAQLRGSTASTFWTVPPLSPLTTYYWQVVARRADVAVPGPIWQFKTRRNVTNEFAHTFAALEAIIIPDFGSDGRAWPYPSTISVRNMPGSISKATVTIHGLSHSYPDDLDILLVGPLGRRIMLLSDAGGSIPVTNLTLTFDQAAAAQPPQAGPLRSGWFRPADYVVGPDGPPLSTPVGPYLTSLAQFGDISPNGDWSLYVFDKFSFEDGGVIAGGWSLSLTLLQADTDGDGLPDDYETANDLNPLDSLDGSADLDGDGHSLGQEYLAGTNPDDPESVLRIRNFHFEGNDGVLEISSGLGRDYRVERLDATTGPGIVIATLPGGDNPIVVRDFGARALPRAFYRIRAVPSAAPFDPDFPPGSEHFRAQAVPFTNSSFNRLFVVSEDARAVLGPGDTLTVEGRVTDQNDGAVVERFRIALAGVHGPGQFAVLPAGEASASYTRQPFPGPAFSYGTLHAGDGGIVLIDSLADSFAAGRFTLILSDTADASRKIQVTGSFRAFLE